MKKELSIIRNILLMACGTLCVVAAAIAISPQSFGYMNIIAHGPLAGYSKNIVKSFMRQEIFRHRSAR